MTIPAASPPTLGPVISTSPHPHPSASTSFTPSQSHSHRKAFGNGHSPTPAPRTSSMPSSPSMSRHSSTGTGGGSGDPPSPRARRKPVPSIIVPGSPSPSHSPNGQGNGQGHAHQHAQLPASHPFAMAQPSPRGWDKVMATGSGSANGTPVPRPQGSPASTIASEVETPGFRDDLDLFYRPPAATNASPGQGPAQALAQRTGGPLPPPRNAHKRSPSGRAGPETEVDKASPAKINANGDSNITNEEITPPSERRGTFHGGLNIHIPETAAPAAPAQSQSTIEAVTTPPRASTTTTPKHSPQPSTANGTPKSSPLPDNASYYNRSLPSLPNNASTTSLGMMSILGSGPGSPSAGTGTGTGVGARNDSVDSRMTGLTSMPSPIDMGRSTTSLGMFSVLDAGPNGVKQGKHARGQAVDEKDVPPLAVYSESLASTKEKKRPGRLSMFKSNRRTGGSALGSASQPMSPVDEEEEADEEDNWGFNISRPPNRRQLWEAGEMHVRDEEGRMVRFADFFPTWDGDSSVVPQAMSKSAVKEGMRSSASLSLADRFHRDIASANAAASIRSHSPRLPHTPRAPSNLRESIATATTTSGSVSGAGSGSGSQPDDAARARPQPKTVVFFIRTFWCGQCQDYTLASIAQLDQAAIARENMRVVVISNGNWRHIKPYRELFKCPFPIYVDASRDLYRLMGMTRSTLNWGPWFGGRAAYNQKSVPLQVTQSLVTAIKLPKRNPGNLFQLGGEFILEPGYDCTFAHRMTNFSNHMEAADVLRIAGCDAPDLVDATRAPEPLDEAQVAEAARLEAEMRDWRAEREAELERVGRAKAARVGKEYVPPSLESRIRLGLDDPDVESTAVLASAAPAAARPSVATRQESEDAFDLNEALRGIDTPFAKAINPYDARRDGGVESDLDVDTFYTPAASTAGLSLPPTLPATLPGGDRRGSTASALSERERDRMDGLEVVVQDADADGDVREDEAELERRYLEAMRLDERARVRALGKS